MRIRPDMVLIWFDGLGAGILIDPKEIQPDVQNAIQEQLGDLAKQAGVNVQYMKTANHEGSPSWN